MGNGKIKGLGDVIATVTKFVGIEPCKKCEDRQAKYNHKWPTRLKPREMTCEEIGEWKEYQTKRTLRLSNEQRKWLCKIYSDVFRQPYYEPCVNCDAAPYLRMIERMDKIVETYD